MNNIEFVKKMLEIATTHKTVYASGGYGQKATAFWKGVFKTRYSTNRNNEIIAKGIDNADADTEFYDCVCLVKSTINTLLTGKKGYTTSPCPDATIDSMLMACSGVTTDLNNIEPGEFLVFANREHCGIYVGVINGKRMAVECTYRWDNGVQLIDIDRPERSTDDGKGNYWKWHGKLSKYFTYESEQQIHSSELRKSVNELIVAKKGMNGEYVKKIQLCLNDYGYGLQIDGIFGSGTEKAVKDFQQKNGLEADGIVGIDTINRLI